MSIEARLRDTRFLYDNGRFEGALLMVLVAAAATSKLRRPNGGDKEAFVNFLTEEGIGHCPVFIDGTRRSMAEFLYKFIRCTLVHEATLHNQVAFIPPTGIDEATILSLCANFPGKALIEHSMVLVIGSTVAFAKENANLPDEVQGTFWEPQRAKKIPQQGRHLAGAPSRSRL